jgi:hypothetical protein
MMGNPCVRRALYDSAKQGKNKTTEKRNEKEKQ